MANVLSLAQINDLLGNVGRVIGNALKVVIHVSG